MGILHLSGLGHENVESFIVESFVSEFGLGKVAYLKFRTLECYIF